MSEGKSNSEIIAGLAEEFVERYRQGERPPVSEYTAQHPELADEIREFFAAVAMVENLAPAESESFGDPGSDASSATLPALKQLGDFRIIREVGRGGMGIVYEAEQVSLGRHVALKVLPTAALPDDKHIQRFQREAKSAARLHHTNIVPVFGVGTEDDLHYYVMQFIQGLPLDEVIEELKKVRAQPTGTITAPVRTGQGGDSSRQRSMADVARSLMTGQFARTQIGESDSGADGAEPAGEHPHLVQTVTELSPHAGDTSTPRLSDTFSLSGSFSGSGVRLGKSGAEFSQRKPFTYWESVANIGLQVADAMQYAHEQGVLHRDIKPSNLLLDMKGTAWVTDFGLAKATDQQDITHTGDILGTLRYMPPEAFEGKADARSDVYSLGLTLYELLCFQPAFGMKDRNQLIKQVTTETAPRLEKLNPEIPRDLVTIVHKAIDRDPSHRYGSARELEEDLQRYLDDEPIKARRISTAERLVRWSRRNRGLAASLGAVCALLLVINIAGPWVTWEMSELNDSLLEEQSKLRLSESELTATVTDLQTRERELEDTGRRLLAETKRANDEAVGARVQADEADRQRTLARRALYSSALFAAQHAILTPEGYVRALGLLDEVRPQAGEDDVRGWEWFYLRAQPPPGALIIRDFSEYPVAVAFSPNGDRVATGDSSGQVKLFDATSGRLLRELIGHQGPVSAVAWDRAGARLATCSADKTARIWDSDSGREVLRLVGHVEWVAGVAWSPDGRRLATAGLDEQLMTWDAASGNNLFTIRSPGDIRCIDWNSAGTWLATGGKDKVVRVWDAGTGAAIHAMEGHTNSVGRVRFSQDGGRIASSSWENGEKAVIIWDAEQGTEMLTLANLETGVHALNWSPDGSKLATAGYFNWTADIWDTHSGANLRTFSGHQARLYDCSWSPNGQRLATASADHSVRIWNVGDEQQFISHPTTIRALAWRSDGSRIAAAGLDQTVRIWDVRTRREVRTYRGHPAVHDVDWNVDGTRIASCGQETAFHVWNAETGQVLLTLRAVETGGINAVAWSPVGTQIASAGDDKTVRIFDGLTGEELQRFLMDAPVGSLCWSGDGHRIGASTGQGALKVWDVGSGAEVFSIPRRGGDLTVVSISPDGTRIAAGVIQDSGEDLFGDTEGGTQGVLSVWDLATQKELFQLRGHASTVLSLDWSDDNSRLLSAGADGRLVLWDMATGRQLLVLGETQTAAGGAQFGAARFSPDELQIASAGAAPGIRLWDTTPSHIAEWSPRLLEALESRISSTPVFDDLKLQGEIRARLGQWDLAADSFDRAISLAAGGTGDDGHRWFTSPWWVIGPYTGAFDAPQPPETKTNLDPLTAVPREAGGNSSETFRWESTVLGEDQGLNLGRFFHHAEQIAGYAQLRIYSPEPQDAAVMFGADDAVRLWFNDKLIHDRTGSRTAVRDDEAAAVKLKSGWNTLLAKVFNRTGEHGLFLRLTDDPVVVARAFTRNERWADALAWWDRAYWAGRFDREVLLGRGRAALGVGREDLATECFDAVLAENEPSAVRGVASAYAGHAQSLINSGANPATKSLARAREMYESLLSGAGASQDARDLADVLLAHQADEIHWTVLEPVRVTSAGGATLTRLDDHSVLASGPNPDHDVYHVSTAAHGLKTISAIRIEALTDDSLPGQGPGRWTSSPGVFVLNRLQAAAVSQARPDAPVAIALDAATADYFYPHLPITPNGPWHAGHGGGKPHVAVYRPGAPVSSREGSSLTFEMTFENGNETGLQLGRFRVSVTDDPAAFDTYDRRFSISRIEDPWARLGAAYAVVNESAAATRWFARALEQRPDIASRRELVERIDALQVDLGSLLGIRADDPLLWDALAQRQAAAGQTDAAAESLARARSLTETLLAESPADDVLAGVLVDLLDRQHDAWTVLDPWSFTSAAGATLTPMPDGSLLAGGSNASGDVYTIRATVDVPEVRTIRLEALPDPSLPGQGPGRHASGNFQLSEFSVFAASSANGEPAERIPLADAWASYEYPYPDVSVRGTIDERDPRLWHVFGRSAVRHVAVFELANPWRAQPGQSLIVQCTHRDAEGGVNLGRFRLSVSDSLQVMKSERQRWMLSENADPWLRLGAAYAALGDSTRAAEWFARSLDQTSGFSARRGTVERIDRLETNLSNLLALRPDDPLLLRAQAKRQTAAGETEAASESLARARLLTEALLEHTTEWTALEPVAMESTGGATLTSQPDNSILAGGTNANGDVYAIQAEVELPEVRAIRLEALPDPSLPNQGPGRHGTGNFQLAAFGVFVVSGEAPETAERLQFADARASFEFNQYGNGSILGTIHDDDPRMWHVFGRSGERHVAVFQLATPWRAQPGQSLVIVCAHMAHRSGEGINLGRFRLSVSADPHALESVQQPESPADEAVAGFLADLLLPDTTRWTVLEPTDMTSAGGATLTRLDDDSVLAGGKNPDHDLYTITASSDLQNITAIRLEALTDDSLPNRGPGRSIGGPFVMDRFKVTGVSGASASAPVDINLVDACADFVSPDRPIRPGGEWHTVAPGDGGRSHVAVYRLARPLESQDGSRLTFELEFNHGSQWPRLHLGRFRLSVTDDPAAFSSNDRRFTVLRIADPCEKLGAAYAVAGESMQAAQWFARALAQLREFAARHDLVQRIDRLEMDVADLVQHRPDDPLLLSVLAKRQWASGQTEAAAESRAKAQRLTEALLAESPDDEVLAGFFADLLLSDTTNWTILEPVEMTSAAGATLTRLDDDSVLAGGLNPDRDRYIVTTSATDLQNITAIRLEALTDDSLPSRGPGRFERGRFVMGRFRVTGASQENPDAPVDIRLTAATADYFHPNYPIRPYGHWHVAPGGGRQGPCTAIFRLQSEQLELLDDSRLEFEMAFNAGPASPGFNLGRFRLSVTDDPAAFETNDRRFAISRIENPCARLCAAYSALGESTRATEWFARALEGAPDFAARREFIERIDQPETDLDALLALHPDDPLLLRALAERQAEAGQMEAAAESHARARSLTEALLAESPDDEALAGFLADVMLSRQPTSWTVLQPSDIRSENGEQFTVEDDGRLFVSGPNPERAVYTIRAANPLTAVSCLRIETLPDERLPYAGAGRYPDNGNFHLSELSLAVAPSESGGDPAPVGITGIIADDEKSDAFAPENALDRDPATFWEVGPRQTQPHEILVLLTAPVQSDEGDLVITLDSGISEWGRHGLGRFRLSVTDDADAFDDSQQRLVALAIEEPWLKLAAAHALEGNREAAHDCCVRAIDASTDLALTMDRLVRLPAGMLDQAADNSRIERLVEARLARTVPGVRQQVWATRSPALISMHGLRSRTAVEELRTRNQSNRQRPTFLSASPRPNSPETDFVTIWTNDNRSHRIEFSLTRRELDELLNTLPEDMQLVSLEEYADGSATLYGALWVAQATRAPWELHERLTAADTAALAESMEAQGFRPTYVNAHPDGKFTTVWAQDGGDSELLLSLTHLDLRTMEREQSGGGLPICIDSHFDGESRRYCLIIDHGVQDVEWKFTLLVGRSEFQSVVDRNVGAGWKPIVTTESAVGIVVDIVD